MSSVNPRELNKYYVGTSDADIEQMLNALNLQSLDDLYAHINNDVKMSEAPHIPKWLNQKDLKTDLQKIADKNKRTIQFRGDGLQNYKVADIVPKVCSIRGLTTAYTPYQPERSQGTLQTLWIYQNCISQITGMEAVNASFYERATCLHEALNCATRLGRKNTVIVAGNIYPGDREVLETMAVETNLIIKFAAIDKTTGQLDLEALRKMIDADTCALAFSQLTCFGNLENFDALTDFAKENQLITIGIVDPYALANEGLKEPTVWGTESLGVDMVVAEGQHLTIGPNFGGPGLGIFGIRFNEKNKNLIRSTAGRFIGKAKDLKGRECKSIILSTREQHIRREKATSNICSNQSFVASACGAALLNMGNTGLSDAYTKAHTNALNAAKKLTRYEGVELAFNNGFYNEFTLKLPTNAKNLILKAVDENLGLGIDITGRCGVEGNLLLLSFSNIHANSDVEKLDAFFAKNFKLTTEVEVKDIPGTLKRKNTYKIPSFSTDALYDYYQKLGKQNLSPDEGIYPLGSCTMKYNPEVNDWAASLPGFTDIHPQATEAESQGCLEIIYQIQEQFKAITGLPGCTTQPVAGAQGELVGLKLFQAYFRDKGESQRKIVLIPRSAHGTNPATATMAGYETKKVGGEEYGIVTIEALPTGEMNFDQFKELVNKYQNRIAAVMVTNPNTAGIFESQFKQMADLVHSVGGFVYMDGANMNAIAGIVDLGKLGVDAVHNNLHKTWSIPHGGGGPGDAIVAVSAKLIDYLPGHQIKLENGIYSAYRTPKTMGSIHRHWGNFAHKVRAYTYLRALGPEGVKRMSEVAVLSARYLYQRLKKTYPVLPAGSGNMARMHEFILTLSEADFARIAGSGTPKAQAIAKVGKLFLDFGFHAPTVAFPEVYGLMIEPTESYSKAELDGFCDIVEGIYSVLQDYPQVLQTVPHFTPIDKVDEVEANKNPVLSEALFTQLPEVLPDRLDSDQLRNMPIKNIIEKIVTAHHS